MFKYLKDILNNKTHTQPTLSELLELLIVIPGVESKRVAQHIVENKAGEVTFINTVYCYNLPIFDMSILIMSAGRYTESFKLVGELEQTIKYFPGAQIRDVTLINGGARYIAEFKPKEGVIEFYAFANSLDKGITYSISSNWVDNKTIVTKRHPHLGLPIIDDIILINKEETTEELNNEKLFKYTILTSGKDLRCIIKNTMHLTEVTGDTELMRWSGCDASRIQSHIEWLVNQSKVLRGFGMFYKELV